MSTPLADRWLAFFPLRRPPQERAVIEQLVTEALATGVTLDQLCRAAAAEKARCPAIEPMWWPRPAFWLATERWRFYLPPPLGYRMPSRLDTVVGGTPTLLETPVGGTPTLLETPVGGTPTLLETPVGGTPTLPAAADDEAPTLRGAA